MIALVLAAAAFTCEFDARVQVGTIDARTAPKLNEASGLVQSRLNPDVFWSHQDNWKDERIFAIHRDGTYLGTWDVVMRGTTSDPEDMAYARGHIYFGDIGANANVWGNKAKPAPGAPPGSPNKWYRQQERTLFIYRITEPKVDSDQAFVAIPTIESERIALVYPDSFVGQREDSETLLIDPDTEDVYVVTKRTARSMVFMAPHRHSTRVQTMSHVIDLEFTGATGGDISADGRLIIIRTFRKGYIWTREPGQTMAEALAGQPCVIEGLQERQGEAVAFDTNNTGTFYTISEGPGLVPMYKFRNVADDGTWCVTTGKLVACFDGPEHEQLIGVTVLP